jgi:predicted ribosome quality control (RQC) complex YloA/Tae2 family protein
MKRKWRLFVGEPAGRFFFHEKKKLLTCDSTFVIMTEEVDQLKEELKLVEEELLQTKADLLLAQKSLVQKENEEVKKESEKAGRVSVGEFSISEPIYVIIRSQAEPLSITQILSRKLKKSSCKRRSSSSTNFNSSFN